MIQRKHWDTEEEKTVRDFWGTRTIKEIAGVLGRTPKSVANRAQRMGIREKENEWKTQEISILLESYMNTPYDKIALHLGRSEKSVKYKVRELGLKKKFVEWEFSIMSPSLAHLLGMYLTDGCLFDPGGNSALQLTHISVDAEYVEASITAYRNVCGKDYVVPRLHHNHNDPKHKQTTWATKMVCRELNEWISVVTDFKNKFPMLLYNSSKECQLSFVAAMLDGDGWISVGASSGRTRYSMGFCSEDKWIYEFSNMLQKTGVRTKSISVQILPGSGKEFYRLPIDIGSFIECGGYFRIYRKMNRLKNYAESVLGMNPQRLQVLALA